MAKDKEKNTARILFVEQGKTQKECARLVGVTEKTLSDWVEKFGWKGERNARMASPVKRMENIKAIITTLSDERIELTRQVKMAEIDNNLELITSLRGQISKIDDAVAKWNKALITITGENKITLAVYIDVMEKVFDALRVYDLKLFMETIKFQEQHLHKITSELG